MLLTHFTGILNLYLDRETYERAGLVGKPYGIKGDRGSKPRWSKLRTEESCLDHLFINTTFSCLI